MTWNNGYQQVYQTMNRRLVSCLKFGIKWVREQLCLGWKAALFKSCSVKKFMQVGSHSSFGLNCWNKVFSPSSLLLMSRFTSFKVSLQVSLNYSPVPISLLSFSNTRDLPSWKSRPPPSRLFPNLVSFSKSLFTCYVAEKAEKLSQNVDSQRAYFSSQQFSCLFCFPARVVWFHEQ